MASSNVAALYHTIIKDVIDGVREHFIDEGLDEQCLQELKTNWEKKLIESKAIDLQESNLLLRTLPTQSGVLPAGATMVQYGAAGGRGAPVRLVQQQDGKTVALIPTNNPAAVSLSAAGNKLQGLMSNPANTATLALPQEWLQQGLQANGGQQVQFQQIGNKQFALTPQQSGNRFTLVRVPSNTPSAPQQANAPRQLTIVRMPSSAAAQPQNLAGRPQILAGRLPVQQGLPSNLKLVRIPASSAVSQQPRQQMSAPQQFALAPAQQPPTSQQQGSFSVDGHGGESSEDDDEDEFNDDDDKDGDDDDQNEDDLDGAGEEEDPLNSDDDVSDDDGDSQDIFDIDNVVVCQYDKISRSRNRWKFQFKDGIMNLEGKDYVFLKAMGDAEW